MPKEDLDFEGSVVLERLAAIGKLDEFWEAVDADDLGAATRLMRAAKIDKLTIQTVLHKMRASDGEH